MNVVETLMFDLAIESNSRLGVGSNKRKMQWSL